MSSKLSDPSLNPLVEELAESFIERYRRGERPAISEYTQRYPEFAAHIQDIFTALVMMEQVQRDLQHATTPSNPLSVTQLSSIGDYRIIREVGRGGMGVVYEAEQVSLGRRVALKVISGSMLADMRHRKRFEREARAAARLHHTNIVPVFGIGEKEGVSYYVMQFINGQGLDDVIRELKQMRAVSLAQQSKQSPKSVPVPTVLENVPAGSIGASLVSGQFKQPFLHFPADGDSSDATMAPPQQPEITRAETAVIALSDTANPHHVQLPGQSERMSKSNSRAAFWESIARVGVQIAQALHYAHEQGIIHRDIKPANLLLDLRGSVWVTDFGLAKGSDQQDLTHTGDVLGTLRYMAPEQFDGQADPRSDLYSLGLTLYELLALRPAFEESERQKLIKQLTTATPPRLRTLDPQIPRDLETIIHKAIDRDPAHRYQSAGALAEDLSRYLGDEPIQARRISPVSRFRRWCRKNPVVAGLTTTIALLITTAAVAASLAAVKFETLANDNGQLAGDLKSALEDAKENLTRANAETQRAEAALAQVQSEQQRAEGNLDLALTALDAVYLDAIGTEKLMGNHCSRPQADEAGFLPSASVPLTDLEKELLKRGLRFYDQFAQQNPATRRAAVQTAQSHFRVGLLQCALGDDSAAETAYRAAIERFEALVKEEPNNVDYHRRLAQSYSGLSRTISDWEAAKPCVLRSVEVYTTAILVSPDDAELYAARGWENGALGRPVEQRLDLIKAAELEPDNREHQCAAASALHWVDPVQGRRFAERALQLDPESSKSALAMAFAFPAVDPEHLKYLNLAIERDQKSEWNWLRRAQAHIWRGENELAVADAQKALELAPNNVLALTELGTALVNLNRHAEAEQSLDRSLSINPHFWITFAVLGELRNSQKQYDKAVEELSHAIELNPSAHHVLKRRAVAFFSLGRYSEALIDLTQALTLQPKDTSTLVCLGPSAIAQCPDEVFKEGLLKLADSVIENSEQPHRGRRERIALNLAFGRNDVVRQDWEALLTADNQNHFDHYQHALLSLQFQDEAEYKNSCRTMLERFANTDDPQAANYVAWTCALLPQALDDYSVAIKLASRAIAAQADDPEFVKTFGAVLYRAGRRAEALEQFNKLPAPQAATDTLSRNSPAYGWYFLAMTHHALGDADQAHAVLVKANAWTDAALADSKNPPAWNRKLTLELLREEAVALLGPVDVPPPFETPGPPLPDPP